MAFLAFVLLPIAIILILSFSKTTYLEFPPHSFTLNWYKEVFTNNKWKNAFSLSCEVAGLSSIISTILSLMFVIGVGHLNRHLRFFLLTIMLSPILMPAIVVAVALFFWFSSIQMIEKPICLVLADILISSPIAIWILHDANNGISKDLDNTAQTLGQSPIQTFLRVRLPLLKYSVITCIILTFITSFDEPVIALFISGTKNVTLPKAMWDGIRYEIDPSTLAISSLVITLSGILTVITLIIGNLNKQNGE